MKKAIVTGGSKGIGLALCKILSENNYLVYNIDITKPEVETHQIITINTDINHVEKLKLELEKIGAVDLLINNAAVQVEKPFIEHTFEEIDQVIHTNLVSLIKLTSLVVNKMQTGGQIINISSVHGAKPRQNKITYDISKAALEMFTKELALELAPKVRVNAIAIGATKTPMNHMFEDKKHLETSIKKVPLNYILEPLDVAKVVYKMISDDFKYLTGSIIVYDAGRSLY